MSPAEPPAAELAPLAARKPVPGVFELLGLPMSSAGNGTGAWLDAAAPKTEDPGPEEPAPEEREEDDEGEGEEDASSVTASPGTGSAPF